MVEKQHTDSTQGIDVEMHQIVVAAGDRVVADHGKLHVLVNQCKQFVHVFLQIFEGIPDVHLRHVFAVGRWVLELESFSVLGEWVVHHTGAIAVTAIHDASAITSCLQQALTGSEQ